jgi:hypothetical protein
MLSLSISACTKSEREHTTKLCVTVVVCIIVNLQLQLCYLHNALIVYCIISKIKDSPPKVVDINPYEIEMANC